MKHEQATEIFSQVGFPLKEVPTSTISMVETMLGVPKTISISPGESRLIGHGENAYSLGANPCTIIVALIQEGRNIFPIVIHKLANKPLNQNYNIEALLPKAIGGIAGGGLDNMDPELKAFLLQQNIQFIPQPHPDADFNVLVISKRIPKSTYGPGIYYRYDMEIQ